MRDAPRAAAAYTGGMAGTGPPRGALVAATLGLLVPMVAHTTPDVAATLLGAAALLLGVAVAVWQLG